MSLALCQAEARLMTMWISIPHTHWAELCPVVPNHQQSACRCSHTQPHTHTHIHTVHPTTTQLHETYCSRHTQGHVNFYNDPFPQRQFGPPTISARDISTADALMEQKVFSVCVCVAWVLLNLTITSATLLHRRPWPHITMHSLVYAGRHESECTSVAALRFSICEKH